MGIKLSEKKHAKIQVLKKSLTRHLLNNVIIKTVILLITLSAIYFIFITVFQSFIWQPNEPIYVFLKNIETILPILILSSCGIGVAIIFFNSWKKVLGYLENVLDATENIYKNDNALIELHPELKEVENQMNQIKFNVKENERVAKDAEQRKNDLVVYLAHDLKTPLTSVIGYLTLLKDESEISQELREKYLSISLNKAERLESLINEFFEITRFNLSTLTLELSQVNLTRMLEQITYEFSPMLSDKNLTIALNSKSDIIIKCDVDKIMRVFDNLIRNAISYSFNDSTIEISVVSSDDAVQFNFVNHGNTIPKEKLGRVFEHFYRLDSARTSKSGGAGLGLAIAKEIIELHGGEIKAYSENEIIAFEMTIPIL